jgi:hypothetical protein
MANRGYDVVVDVDTEVTIHPAYLPACLLPYMPYPLNLNAQLKHLTVSRET